MPAYRTRPAGRTWQRRRPPSNTRDVEVDMDLEAKRFQKLAPVLGWCGSCGVTVDEENGKLHASDCPYLPPERRRST